MTTRDNAIEEAIRIMAELWPKEVEGAKFKAGDVVIINECYFDPSNAGRESTVVAVNHQDEGVYEYCLADYPWLVYEEELELKESQ